jgi:hypothetical protein
MGGISISSSGTTGASGTYTGNATLNTAITHGLGKIPTCVMILKDGGGTPVGYIFKANPTILMSIGTGGGSTTVTIMDTGSFYLGGDSAGMNANGTVYWWVAMP